jgi:hypothetical protein
MIVFLYLFCVFLITIIILATLGFELKASCLLDRGSTT